MQAKRVMACTALVAAALAGCEWKGANQGRSPAGTVAIIDLDAIAHRLGSDRQIAESITQRQSALYQQLAELAKSYNAELAERKKAQPEGAAGEGGVTLATWQQQANANLNQVKQRAEQDLKSHRAALVRQFRDQIKPAARRVAYQRGLSVIVTKNDTVLFDYTDSVDITEAVIDALLATSGNAAAATAPVAQASHTVPLGAGAAATPANGR